MPCSPRHLVRILSIAAFAAGGPTISQAVAQTKAADSSAVKLTPASNSDKTATVSIPEGWTLAKGSSGFVYVTGPQDQRINLGLIALGKNGPAGVGPTTSDVLITMPFTSSLKDKFTAILQAGAAQQGKPKLAITYASESPTRMQMCSRFLGSWMDGSDSRSFEAIVCSLRPDWLGFYKNIVFLLQVPTSRAAQDRPVVEKIAHTYRVTPDMFRKMLATYTPLPPAPATGPAPMMPGLAPYQDPTNSECFDYSIIRESPPWEVPMRCGGINPYQ